MPKRKIDDLFEGAPPPTPDAYWKDLRDIVARVKAGQSRPTWPKITSFLNQQHGTTFGVTSVRDHYRRVYNGQD